MSKDDKKDDAPEAKASAKKADTADPDTQKVPVSQVYEEALDKGYLGEVPDQTPNENYSVGGVIAGADTPETLKTDDAEKNLTKAGQRNAQHHVKGHAK